MSIGKIKEFDVKCGVRSSYVDRLKMYFKVNNVAEDMKLPILIASIGDEGYELMENLLSPDKPADSTFAKVEDLMRQHLQPTPSALAERYRFRQRRQNVAENVTSYVAELKKLSRHCKFAGSLSENLRDQFVCGLKSDVIRQRLFAEKDTVTFSDAVQLATALEAAERDSALVEGTGREADSMETGAVHVIASGSAAMHRRRSEDAVDRNRRYIQRRAPDNNKRNVAKCVACGSRNHENEHCRFRNYM